MVTLRRSPSPTLCVVTDGWSRSARWTMRRSAGGIGSMATVRPVCTVWSAMRSASLRSDSARLARWPFTSTTKPVRVCVCWLVINRVMNSRADSVSFWRPINMPRSSPTMLSTSERSSSSSASASLCCTISTLARKLMRSNRPSSSSRPVCAAARSFSLTLSRLTLTAAAVGSAGLGAALGAGRGSARAAGAGVGRLAAAGSTSDLALAAPAPS